jgi:hypothetical protein
LQQAVGAAAKTLASSGVNYSLTLERSHLFGTSRPVPALALYDLQRGIGYAKLVPGGASAGTSRALYLFFLPTRLYLAQLPPPRGVLPPGKIWVAVALTGGRTNDAFAAQAEGLTPLLALDEVAWGARAATLVGQPVVDHVPLNEYRITISLTRALAAARRAGAPAVSAAIAREAAARSGRGAHTLDVLAWVDGPGYVEKLETGVPGSGLGTASFSLTGFGVSVPRNPPLPSQTIPLSALRSGSSPWALALGA